MLKFQLVGGCF